MCDVKTMCYIVFITHSLDWRYIKTALQEYVISEDIKHLSSNINYTGLVTVQTNFSHPQ